MIEVINFSAVLISELKESKRHIQALVSQEKGTQYPLLSSWSGNGPGPASNQTLVF
jgi:hypothetical protein